jgi:hypothetical protein
MSTETHVAHLQKIAQMIVTIDHAAVQCDHIHACEHKHQATLELDKLDRHEAIRLCMHVIHVQQLQLVGAKIEYDEQNPFRRMQDFEFIGEYVKNNSPDMETLY